MRIKGLFWILTGLLLTILAKIVTRTTPSTIKNMKEE